MKGIFTLILIFTTLTLSPAYSLESEGFKYLELSSGMIDILKEQSEFSRELKPEAPLLLQKNHPAGKEISDIRNSLIKSTGIEIIYLWEPPEIGLEGEDLYLLLLNVMSRISGLKGIEYYSASQKINRILFTEAWSISDPESPAPSPDPIYSELPEKSVQFAHFDDTRFGVFTARFNYQVYPDSINMVFTNLTPLHLFRRIEVLEPEKLYIMILIFPGENKYLFYGCALADLRSLPGFERSKTESLYNRLTAMRRWFSEELSESREIKKPQ